MSIVNELFDRALELKKGKRIVINCEDHKQLHSLRTMIYRQCALYERKTGVAPDLMCSKEGVKLTIQKRNFTFRIEEVEDES